MRQMVQMGHEPVHRLASIQHLRSLSVKLKVQDEEMVAILSVLASNEDIDRPSEVDEQEVINIQWATTRAKLFSAFLVAAGYALALIPEQYQSERDPICGCSGQPRKKQRSLQYGRIDLDGNGEAAPGSF